MTGVEDRGGTVLSVACTYSHDVGRLSRLSGWSPERVRRYLQQHRLREDARVPRDWIAARVPTRDVPTALFTCARRLQAHVHNAHATYCFIWPDVAPHEPWRHGPHVGGCSHDLETYHGLVMRACVQSARRWRDQLLDDVVNEPPVLVRRMCVEDGWGRGPRSVPWQLLAHPANLRLVPRHQADARFAVEPDALYRDAVAWNQAHGTALIDATEVTGVHIAPVYVLRNAN